MRGDIFVDAHIATAIVFLVVTFYWPLEGNRADSRKFLVENPTQKSGSQRWDTGAGDGTLLLYPPPVKI